MDNRVEEAAHRPPTELPRWLEDLLPEESAARRLSTVLRDGERWLRLTELDGSTRDFATVAEASEAHHSSKDGLDLAIEEDAYEHFGEGHRTLTYPVGKKGYVGMLVGYTDERRRKSLESSYRESLKALELYLEDPTDFVRAYRMIDGHPAFWTAFDLNQHPWSWDTLGYCSKLRQFVRAKENGTGYRISLDGGGHVETAMGPDKQPYSEHYGDWRLEVTADSFEEAILEFAARLVLAYDAEGNSVPEDSFPYPVPEWILDLKRIDDDEEEL